MDRGIKESKELMEGVMILSLLLFDRFKDGFQMDDMGAVFKALGEDPKIVEAFKGLSELPHEFKDLSLEEGFELARVVLEHVPKFFKK
jgi:hypothetical protein